MKSNVVNHRSQFSQKPFNMFEAYMHLQTILSSSWYLRLLPYWWSSFTTIWADQKWVVRVAGMFIVGFATALSPWMISPKNIKTSGKATSQKLELKVMHGMLASRLISFQIYKGLQGGPMHRGRMAQFILEV